MVVVCVVCPAGVGLVVVVVTRGVVEAAHTVTFYGVQFQAVLCRGEPSCVVHEIVVDVLFPSLGWSSLLPIAFLLG